jgi:HEAT repeat protein
MLRTVGQRIGESLSAGATDLVRDELVRRAETMHAARALFALDEICVPPRLLAPPPTADPTRTEALPEDALAVLPNLPDWTLLSGIYRTASLTLRDVFVSDASVLITGEPGSGKSSALAYLAIRCANRDPELGAGAEFAPFLIHAADLRLGSRSQKDPLQPLIAAAQQTASSAVASRLPGYIRLHFRQRRGLLLLDGLDELPAAEIAPIAEWLAALLEQHPGNRVVAAGPAQGYDGLAAAGLAPVTIAPWSEHERRLFLSRWGAAWQKYVVPTLPKGRIGDLDPSLVTGWLLTSIRGLTPLELTMRAWAAYAGDVFGPKVADGLEAYVARFLSPDERQVAELAAVTWIAERQGAFPEASLHRGTPVSDLIEAGILVRRPDSRLSFFQPAVGAYLAGRGMAANGLNESAATEGWAPAEEAMRWFAALGDPTAQVERHLQVSDDVLASHLLLVARWLREAAARAPWRSYVLRALANLAQDADKPYGLRLRAVHALASAQEATVAILFRRLLTSEAPSSRILAALGLGAVRDEESIKALAHRMEADRELLVRQAACLALVGIGGNAALEGLGHALLNGEEGVRLAAGEALACDPDEGYGMLRDALEVDNQLTRRAAVFGLGRIPESWALEMLEKVQVEDGQWVVRGAAAEVVERRKTNPWKITAAPRDPSELPWLIAYGAREGLGIAPGRAALEIVRRALGNGTTDERIAALEALGSAGSEEFALELYSCLKSSEPHLRDAACEALWRLAASGVQLPALSAVGLG